MSLSEISWNELTEVTTEDIVDWPIFSSDQDPDWPYQDSEDYYQDQGEFLLPKVWKAPKKKNDAKLQLIQITAVELDELLKDDSMIFLIQKEISLDDNYQQDFLPIKKLSVLDTAVIFAFPRKYLLPVRSSLNSRQAFIAFYDPYEQKYLDKYIFAKKQGKFLYKNNSYRKEQAEADYIKARDSYAEYLCEMAHSETSTNCKIFGIDAKTAFLKSAQVIFNKY